VKQCSKRLQHQSGRPPTRCVEGTGHRHCWECTRQKVVALGGRATAGAAHWDPICGPKRFRLKLGVTLTFYNLKTERMHYTASFPRVGQ